MKPFRLTFFAALLVALATCALAPRARAQQDAVGVRLEVPQKMYVGDAGDLQIVVSGTRNVDAPDLSSLRDFEITYRAPQDFSSQSIIIHNGRMQNKITVTFAHLYSIKPRRAGRLEIPAIPVVIDGQTHLTSPVVVEVVEPREASGFKLEVASDHASAFVGEPITVRMVWTIPPKSQLHNVQFDLPLDGPAHELMPGPVTRSLNQNDGRSIVLPLNNVQVLALHESTTVTIDRTIIPREPGEIVIGPARADFLLVVGQRPANFNDIFPLGSQPITDRQFSSAPSLTIRVDPLPALGKPADFSGLVGNYAIAATADASTVAVGDPINLNVVVSGPYPLSMVPALDLSKQSNLKDNFRIPREPILPQTNAGVAVFQAMIRARNADVRRIDPVSLNYFDPKARQYRTIQTGAIPITVSASTTVSLPDEPESDAPPPPPPERRPGGLPDIDRTPITPGGSDFDLHAELRSVSTIAMLAAPPVACVLAFASISFVRWRRRDPAAARRRAAMTRLRRTIRRGRGSPVETTAAGLCNFAADWFDQPRDSLTAPRAGELLSATGSPAGARLRELLLVCDALRFGGSLASAAAHNPSELPAQAIALAREFAVNANARSEVAA